MHQTWQFWCEVLVPAWVINKDTSEKNPKRTAKETIEHQLELISTYTSQYLQRGGMTEQTKCERLLEKYLDICLSYGDTESLPWPQYLQGSTYLGKFCYMCNNDKHSTSHCSQYQSHLSSTHNASSNQPTAHAAQAPEDNHSDGDSLFGDSISDNWTWQKTTRPREPSPHPR